MSDILKKNFSIIPSNLITIDKLSSQSSSINLNKKRKKKHDHYHDHDHTEDCNCNYREDKTLLYIVSIIGVGACLGVIIWIIVTICKKKTKSSPFLN